MLYAHMFNAPKRTGYKVQLVICSSPDLSEAGKSPDDDEKYFDSKAEAKAYAKQVNAQPHNY